MIIGHNAQSAQPFFNKMHAVPLASTSHHVSIANAGVVGQSADVLSPHVTAGSRVGDDRAGPSSVLDGESASAR